MITDLSCLLSKASRRAMHLKIFDSLIFPVFTLPYYHAVSYIRKQELKKFSINLNF